MYTIYHTHTSRERERERHITYIYIYTTYRISDSAYFLKILGQKIDVEGFRSCISMIHQASWGTRLGGQKCYWIANCIHIYLHIYKDIDVCIKACVWGPCKMQKCWPHCTWQDKECMYAYLVRVWISSWFSRVYVLWSNHWSWVLPYSGREARTIFILCIVFFSCILLEYLCQGMAGGMSLFFLQDCRSRSCKKRLQLDLSCKFLLRKGPQQLWPSNFVCGEE